MTPIVPDTLHVLADWKAGKPVRTIELGHVHRMKDNPGMSPAIDMSVRIYRDQVRAHAYCFHVIESFVPLGIPDFDTFLNHCAACQQKFLTDSSGLTAEEIEGANSLAWKAMAIGWRKAVDWYRDTDYIFVQSSQSTVAA
jgi:hypothetical protein